MLDKINRIATGYVNYRNPLSMSWQRFAKRPIVNVVDRATGLTFKCRRGADRMLAETFYSKIYDIPGLAIRSGDVVVDIGANHGFFCCRAAWHGALVYAFEPDPDTFRQLQENIRANGLEKRVMAFPCAVGEIAGSIELICTDELGGGCTTTIQQVAEREGFHATRRTTVPVVTLEGIFKEHSLSSVRICKLDCEGAEYGILRALPPQYRERIDAMALEYHLGAYSLPDLINMICSWPNFNVAKVPEFRLKNANITVVKSEALQEWARQQHY